MTNQVPLRVEIGWNNAGVATNCAVCGTYIDAMIGFEPFIVGTKDMVCDDCASSGEIVGPVPSGFVFTDPEMMGAAAEFADGVAIDARDEIRRRERGWDDTSTRYADLEIDEVPF